MDYSALRKLALKFFLVFLGLTALVAIVSVLTGSFGELQLKILATSFAISSASILAMSCAAFIERKKRVVLGISGVLLSAMAACLVIAGLWLESEEYDLRAIELLLRMALDEDDEVRKGASYFGLSRLPENHPARPRINETKKFHMAQRLDRIRQHAFKLIENGEFKKVEGLLHEIDPNDGRYFNSESDRDVVRVVYDAIAKKLADVRKSNESPEVN